VGNQVSRLLDEEHQANLELLGQLEARLARAPRSGPVDDAQLSRLLARVADHLERDVGRHFDFEEAELFPRLAAAGDGDIAALLTDEHDAIREVARELLPLARGGSRGALSAAEWQGLVRTSLELVERQVAHIQKEGMALLPLLDDLLDDDTDQTLALSYAAA
jgi:hemerythrin-like domain-containing protein